MKRKISIVIPAYNEEKTVIKVLREIKSVLKKAKVVYELIVVDDGSKDKTAEVVKKEKGVKLIQHPHNKGYGAALKTGALKAKYSYVFYIDADNQHYMKDVPRLIKEIKDYDMVVGSRKQHTSLLRWPAKVILSRLANFLAERKIPDINSGFRIVKKKLVKKYINILPNTFSFTTTITIASFRDGHSVKYVPIHIKKRKAGKSTIHPVKDTFRFIILLLRTTMLFSPLRVFLPISLILFLVGFLYLLYDLYLLNISEISVLIILSAIIIFSFGLVADQISILRRGKRD